MGPVPCEDTIQLLPDVGPGGVAFDHTVVDRPALLALAPGDNLDLDPVLLDIDARGQEQAAFRDDTDAVASTSTSTVPTISG